MPTQTLAMQLESPHFPADQAQIYMVTGHEEISSLFAFEIGVVFGDGSGVDVASMEGADVSLVFLLGGTVTRQVHGMIAAIDDQLDTQVDSRTLVLHMVPRAHRLTLVTTQEIFLGLSVPDIITQKLALVQLEGADVEMRLSQTYPARDFVVQYQETDLAFVSRLAEHLGISFFFEHDSGVDKMVFTDNPSGFHAAPNCAQATYEGGGVQLGVYQITATTRVIPKSYIVQDYNYETPLVDVSGQAIAGGGLAGGVVEYAPLVYTPAEAASLATVRAQEHDATHYVFKGLAALPQFAAGAQVQLMDHRILGDINLLLTRVDHAVQQAVGTHGGSGDQAYTATFQAVNASIWYRPPRRTRRPRVHGLVTAVVEPMIQGDTSRFSKIDTQGQYTLRFLFDTANHGSGRPSLPVRMLQPHAGPAYGMHFPLKPGIEVLVGFHDGDPDRPFLVGAASNQVTPSPVAQASNVTHRILTETGILIELKDGVTT